jgi:chromosome segregation ATPase
MASTIERISIVETKVSNLDEKLDDLKIDVKDVHDCLDRTRDEISEQLNIIHESSTKQHAELSNKIHEIEQFRNKWTYMFLGGLAVLGWVSGHLDIITKIFN